MAIVNEKLAEKSAARGIPGTPALTPSSSKLPQKIRAASPIHLSTSFQVPRTQSPISSPLKRSHLLERPDHADDISQDIDMAPQAESETEPDETIISTDTSDAKRDLAPMDWNNFEHRYAKAIQVLSDKEDGLIEDFNRLSDAFAVWADSSAEQDNGRAWKRLRTRERYVQIQENKLEEKKQHYLKVVDAFKQALQLFGE